MKTEEILHKHTKAKPLKDAIIKNGIAYKVHRMLYISGCGQDPCEKCDMRKHCDRAYTQPCRLFNKGRKLAYFKRVKDIKPLS